MAEYIAREAVLAKIDQYTRRCWPTVSYVESIIQTQPAADVDPVRHGLWVQCFEDWRQQIEGSKCSVCGFEYYGTGINHFRFCPNCGAKMDGGGEDAAD